MHRGRKPGFGQSEGLGSPQDGILNGVLIIDKPKGWTSHTVVDRIRKLLKVKKAGHGGTLDPLATGVLPVYIGEGTKLVSFNLDGLKEYWVTMKLGQETDTLDAEGQVVSEKKDFFCSREQMEEVLNQFRGEIVQIPPLFSAIKLRGKPLYRRARAGEKPPLRERRAVIHSLQLEWMSLPVVRLAIQCGRGTYIRSLCAEIGRVLGCGAHVVELRRLRSGPFTIHQALAWDQLPALADRHEIQARLIPLHEGVKTSGKIEVGKEAAEKIRQGRILCLRDLPQGGRKKVQKGERISLMHGTSDLLAIAEVQADEESIGAENLPILRPLRVFHTPAGEVDRQRSGGKNKGWKISGNGTS
jgi:tRNA pseudouridine55 synthase